MKKLFQIENQDKRLMSNFLFCYSFFILFLYTFLFIFYDLILYLETFFVELFQFYIATVLFSANCLD